ncbi:hypothetical protein ACFQZ0_03775 [Streptomyces erythrogriseus]
MDVSEVLLPGVGMRYEFVNHEGDRVGVVAPRSGSSSWSSTRATIPTRPTPC